MLAPSRPSVRWSPDVVLGSFGDGRRFRIRAVNDDFTRECSALVANASLFGSRVAHEWARIIRLYDMSQVIVIERALIRHWSKDNDELDRVCVSCQALLAKWLGRGPELYRSR